MQNWAKDYKTYCNKIFRKAYKIISGFYHSIKISKIYFFVENMWNMEIRISVIVRVNFYEEAISKLAENRAIAIETRLGKWTR